LRIRPKWPFIQHLLKCLQETEFYLVQCLATHGNQMIKKSHTGPEDRLRYLIYDSHVGNWYLWLQVDMDVRLSAQFGPLKRPKRLSGRPAEAKWTCRKQLPLPLDSSVHESHASDSWPLGRCPAAAQSPAASVGMPACLPERRPASARSSPCLRPGTPPRLRSVVAQPPPRTCRR
jgi:hypothetical protein